ncbi:AMP-binding enzyme, partial [Aduncisulcus paluster]
GNTKYLIDDIFIARPTVLCAVPRVLQKIFDSVMKKVKKKPGLIRWLFLHGLSRVKHWKYVQQRLKIPTKYDFLFKDVRNLLGNRCKQIVSGSAPLSPECAAFVGCAMGVELTEGFGMTETAAAGVVQVCPVRTYGNCGKPLGDQEIKLVDVPELEYLSTDPNPRGELCIRGANIFCGYHGLPDKTKEVFDKDGYFHTGDIAQYVDGRVQIIDRKKCVYKLSHGEFVSAEALERAYSSSPYVEGSFVYCNRYESFVLAVVQINDKEVREGLVTEGVLTQREVDELDTRTKLCNTMKVISFVHKSVILSCREAGLRSFEIPRAIILECEEWTIDNKCMTPSLKIRRPFLRSMYERRFLDIFRRIKVNVPAGTRLKRDEAAEIVCDSLALGELGPASITSGSTMVSGGEE